MTIYKKKTSMQDIADYLNISKNSVSLALNNKPGVSDELRRQVIKAAEKLNYASYGNGKGKGNNFIIITPEYISNDKIFYYEIYWAIEKHAKENGYNTIMTSVTKEMEDDMELPGVLFEIESSAIIVVGVLSKNYIRKLQERDCFLVMVDNYYDDIAVDSIVTANEEGAFTAVKHLIEKGHTKIGYIGSIDMTASLYERWQGYSKAMYKYGLAVDKSYCILDSSSLKKLLGDPSDLEPYIDKMDNYPTAWFCGGDRIAIALINLLNSKGIRVPEDISIVGFDDIELSHLIVPALTTVRVKREQLGVKTIDLIIEHIENKEQDDVKRKLSIYGELIHRNSVADLS